MRFVVFLVEKYIIFVRFFARDVTSWGEPLVIIKRMSTAVPLTITLGVCVCIKRLEKKTTSL